MMVIARQARRCHARSMGRHAALWFLTWLVVAGAANAAERLVVTRGADGILQIRSADGSRAAAAIGQGPRHGHKQEVPGTASKSPRSTSRPVVNVPSPWLSRTIEETGRRAAVDPRLIHAVIAAESAYDERALSKKGAIGLMQLMPATATELGVDDPWDPVQNLSGGARYLRQLLDRFGDLRLALAAYNAGPSAVDQHGGVPPFPETRTYVQRVLGRYGRGAGLEGPGPASYRPFGARRDAQGRFVLATP